MGRIALILFLLSIHISAFAQNVDCKYALYPSNVNVWFNGNAIQTYFTVHVTRAWDSSPSDICNKVALFFSMGNAQSYQRQVFKSGQGINYTVENTNPTGTLKTFADHSGPGEYLSGDIGVNGSVTLTGLFKMPIQNLSGGEGQYQDILNVTAYGYKNANSNSQSVTKQMLINVQTQTFMELSVVPEGGPHQNWNTYGILDFGELTTGKELGMDLIVKSNIGYRVSLYSNNLSKFKHYWLTGSIPYQFKFGGNVVNLTTAGFKTVAIVPAGSANSGDRYNMRAKVLDTTGQPLGDYWDTITIEVQSN